MKLNSKTLRKFLEIAGEKMSGEWVVIGGTVLPMLGINHRVTVDIDFVSKSKKEDTLKLMSIADELGLSIETINQAGAYFLYQIPDFERNLIILYEGSKAKIYRPNLFLYIQLKIKRFSDSDVLDCLEYIKYAENHNEFSDKERIEKLVQVQIAKESNKEKINKLKEILKALDSESGQGFR